MRRGLCCLAALLAGLLPVLVPLSPEPVAAVEVSSRYTNPLKPTTADGQLVENCPDPSVLRGRGAYRSSWFMYCTNGRLNDTDSPRRLPMLRSRDLVNWQFVGSALSGRPTWASKSSGLWAPDVVYSSTYGRYYMTFTVTDTVDALSGEPGCEKDRAIGVAVSTTPYGPWQTASAPLVPPQRIGPGCSFASTIDPDMLGESRRTDGVLYYGGFRDGIKAQAVRFSATGVVRVGEPQSITAGTRYEAGTVVAHGGYYYLFASSGACCNGALSGYGVFAGRSTGPFGPFVDRHGSALLAPRVGGSPVLAANGNRWIGPGHNTVFRDWGGQWWTAYHAIDRNDPFFAGRLGSTRRPVLLDPLDWPGGWPSVRSGRWASTRTMPAPAAQPTQTSQYQAVAVTPDRLGPAVPTATDEFSADLLDDRWSWLHGPAPQQSTLRDGALRIPTQDEGLAAAPIPTEAAPQGSFVVQTAVALDVPASGPEQVRAGLVVYGADDRYVTLAHSARDGLRLTEFGSRVPADVSGVPIFGSSTVGTPANLTWLRIVRRVADGQARYRAYTSTDGTSWIRGATWRNDALAGEVRIGLVATGDAGWNADFQHVRVWALA